MSLDKVWIRLLDGGLIRADQAIGIDVHPTPEIAGKPSRWLLDVVVALPVGSGDGLQDWHTGPLHRTLAQVGKQPVDAPQALARLLAQLDESDASGVIRADTGQLETGPHPDRTAAAGALRFACTAFTGGPAAIDAGDHHGRAAIGDKECPTDPALSGDGRHPNGGEGREPA